MEHLTSLLSSRGLLRSCRSHNRYPASSCDHIDEDLLRNHVDGGTIYLCTDAVPRFTRDFLPKIKGRFVLVTGDSDLCGGSHENLELLEDSRCTAWFAQNLDFDHPKLRPVAIGQDYHTTHEKPGLWELHRMLPFDQEHQLIHVQREMWGARFLGAYCNFIGDRGDRQECLDLVDKSIIYRESGRIPRSATWRQQANFWFVLSPRGIGLDCHRTWEAIALGCIPIVKRNPHLAELFTAMPVLQVDDWREVTRARLEAFLCEANIVQFDVGGLFLANWMRRLSGLPFDPVPRKLTAR